MPSIPISEFEHRVAKWAKVLSKTREPLEITQRGRTNLVVMDKASYDQIQQDRLRMQALEIKLLVDAAERDIAEGRVYTQEEVEGRLRKLDRKAKRRK